MDSAQIQCFWACFNMYDETETRLIAKISKCQMAEKPLIQLHRMYTLCHSQSFFCANFTKQYLLQSTQKTPQGLCNIHKSKLFETTFIQYLLFGALWF